MSKKIPVAIQLYSLRDVAPKDVPGTLRKVAAMGYEGVEFAGYYNLDGTALRKMLDDCGLRCAGAHVGLDAVEGDAFEKTVEMNKLLGNDRLIVPWDDMKNVPQTIARLNAAHVRAKASGMRGGYHNHTSTISTFQRPFHSVTITRTRKTKINNIRSVIHGVINRPHYVSHSSFAIIINHP